MQSNDKNMTLAETRHHIETELELPFPWKLEHIERGDHAITAADGTFLYHDILWFYIQALEREVERLTAVQESNAKLLDCMAHELNTLQGLHATDLVEATKHSPDSFWELEFSELLSEIKEAKDG